MHAVTVELSHERVHADDCEECDERADGYVDLIRRYILVSGPLTQEQGRSLREIAAKRPVHKTLLATPQIMDELDVADQA